MIRPGLERITRLLAGVRLSWLPIHVAGTNGKGSICAYLSAMLSRSAIRCGRFTSPHLIDRWDCIVIDEEPIAEGIFKAVEARVKERNEREAINASEFELLTATAFEIFNQEKVQVGVVECGMGGRLDSTNVVADPLVTVISKIGFDHQDFLGNTLKQIAFEKAGILKPGTVCFIDGSNESDAITEVERVAKEQQIHLVPSKPETSAQEANLGVALLAFAEVRRRLGTPSVSWKDMVHELANVRLPGRFQRLDISKIAGKPQRATLDGAHNAQAWAQLRLCVDQQLRGSSLDKPVVWVLACSASKNPQEMFGPIPATDRVVLTEFGPVDGMPWVKAKPAEDIMPWRLRDETVTTTLEKQPSQALRTAAELAEERELIIAGSLYLVSDVLRLVRASKT